MKSLEMDAVRAQAVIAKAQELSRDSTHHSVTAGSNLSSADISFAGMYSSVSAVFFCEFKK